MKKISLAPLLFPLLLSLTISACGSSTSYTDNTPPPTTTTPPPVTLVDAFFTAVLNLIGDGNETTTEPAATDTVAATAPEDTEPVALK